MMMLLAFCLTAVAGSACTQAATVKNVTLKKVGKKYYGFKKGKKIKKKWGIVKAGKKKYKYYFGKNGAAYTGVHAIGKYWYNTKLYYFNKKGRLQTAKTDTLQKLSAEGADLGILQAKIRELDPKDTCKNDEACGQQFCVYKNKFTVYFREKDGKNVVDHLEAM